MKTRGKTRVVMICLFAALLTASDACKTPRTAEYGVLSAFVDGKLASRKNVVPVTPKGDGVSRLVIKKTTESDEESLNLQRNGNGQPIPWTQTVGTLQREFPSLQRSTIDAFRDANRRQTSFQRSFRTVFDYELVETSQVDSIFKGGGWPAFYNRFPGSTGILAFSRVGFSSDGKQALFYVSNRCGELCGGGCYVVMERRSDQWVIGKEIETWVS